MRHILLCLSLLFGLSCLAQEKKFTFSGIVTSCFSKKPLEGVSVTLLTPDGYQAEAITDKTGKYTFTFSAGKLPVSVLLTWNSMNSEAHNSKLGKEIYRDTLDKSGSSIFEHDVCLNSAER